MNRAQRTAGSTAFAAAEAAVAAALFAAAGNVVWVQLGTLGAEPTRRPAWLLLAGFLFYVVAGLVLAIAIPPVRRWRGAAPGPAFGWTLATLLAGWTFLFIAEGLLDGVPSRLAAALGVVPALLVCASPVWAFGKRLPNSAPAWGRWAIYPAALGVLGWPLTAALLAAQEQTAYPGPEGRPSVVLLVLDTLRADQLSSYGHPGATTPALDSLARDGVRFTTAVSPSSWTLPAVSSIMTGQLPSVHGTGAETLTLDPRIPTLAKVLRAHGYATAGFAGGPFCKADFGLNEGFEDYDDELEPLGGKVVPLRLANRAGWFLAERHLIPVKRRASAINAVVFPWLERVRHRPYFLFINYFDVHAPYDPPAGYRPAGRGRVNGYVDWWKERFYRGELTLTADDRAHLLALYEGEVRYLDHEVGRLLAKLRDLNALDRTIVVATADHGEAFLEHGLLSHGDSLYEEEIHVPLLVRFPAGVSGGQVVRTPVQSLDILPTILDLLGLPAPAGIHGVSLVGSWQEARAVAERPIVSQLYREREWASLFARVGPNLMVLREGQRKYVVASDGREELYRLDADPEERRDLSRKEAEVAGQMARRLRALVGEPLWPRP